MQQRGEDAPSLAQFIVSDECGGVSAEDLQNEPGVSVGECGELVREALLVRQVEFGHDRVPGEPGLLHKRFQVHGLVGLHAHHELVARQLLLREQQRAAGRRLELDTHLGLALVERLAGAHDERHALPAAVPDVHDQRRERRRQRIVRHALVVRVARLLPERGVLPGDAVVEFDFVYALQHLDFFIPDVVARRAHRRLHCDHGEDLHEVVLHDVADDAVLVKVAPAPLRAEILLESHGDGGYVVAVPERLEGVICEPHDHQVLHHLLPDVVVDTESFTLLQQAADVPVELLKRLQISAERLLNDEPVPPRRRHARILQRPADWDEEVGRDGEVEQAIRTCSSQGGLHSEISSKTSPTRPASSYCPLR